MHKDHELHTRRRGRNMGLLAVLLGFIVLMFGLTIVKIQTAGFTQGFDHVVRPEIVTTDPAAQAPEADR